MSPSSYLNPLNLVLVSIYMLTFVVLSKPVLIEDDRLGTRETALHNLRSLIRPAALLPGSP